MNIYVGNLSLDVTEDDLRKEFEAFGQVATANVIKDKFTGESRGFGFVEMPSKSEAQEAMTALNSCLLYTSPSPRDVEESRMPSSA